MERQLLLRIRDLEQGLTARVTAQDQKIAALETEVRARDHAITRLTDTLARLLGPLDRDGSSPS